MSLNSQTSKAGEGSLERAPESLANLDRIARALIARIQKNQDDLDAIEELAAHYAEAGDQASLVNLLEGWGDTLRDATTSADAYVRAADASLLGLFDRERARALYERALSRDAAHEAALDRVLRLLEDDYNLERQKQVLKFVAFRLGEQASDATYHASVYYRLGHLYEAHFNEPGKAAASYRSAIERNPRLLPAIIGARRLYQSVGNGKAVAALYEFEIEATPHIDDKRALLVALAEVRRRDLTDLDGAIAVLRRALQSAPGDIEALRMLGEVLVERSQQADLTDKAAAQVDRKRAAEVFFQLGSALPERDAHAYLQRALALCPEHEKAAKRLYDLGARDRDDKTQLVDLADLQEADPTGPIELASAADGVMAAEGPVRNSAEVWLSETAPRAAALSTGELLPIEVPEALDERPSSLPPRTLASGTPVSLLAPPEALRAPPVPSGLLTATLDPRESAEIPILRARRSVPPPPPAAGRSSMPPSAAASEPLPASATPRPSAPPPAYAEIPGESGEHFTPVRGHHAFKRHQQDEAAPLPPARSRARREPTLPTWRLPSEDAASEALTPIVNELPAVKPQYDDPEEEDAAARLRNLPVASTRPAPITSQPSTAPRKPSTRPASHLHAVQGERFADLAKQALQSVPQDESPSALVTAPEPVADAGAPSLDVEISALSDSNFYVGFESRIVSGGLFVATYTPLPERSRVELRVALPGGFHARALGRVWRVRSQVDPFSEQVPGMWVQLTELSEEALRLFERFASHRPPLFIET
jgi:Tetratricopeptide repeat